MALHINATVKIYGYQNFYKFDGELRYLFII